MDTLAYAKKLESVGLPENQAEIQAEAIAHMSHHPSTAPAQWHALSGFHSGTVLNVVSATPAHCLVAKTAHAAPLNGLATNAGETCGLVEVLRDQTLTRADLLEALQAFEQQIDIGGIRQDIEDIKQDVNGVG